MAESAESAELADEQAELMEDEAAGGLMVIVMSSTSWLASVIKPGRRVFRDTDTERLSEAFRGDRVVHNAGRKTLIALLAGIQRNAELDVAKYTAGRASGQGSGGARLAVTGPRPRRFMPLGYYRR